MVKLVYCTFLIFVLFTGCDQMFNAPCDSVFHKESEAGGISAGNYISSITDDSDTNTDAIYGEPHYYYVKLGESDIEIYVLNSSRDEILYAVKGTYSVSYSSYQRFYGNIEYSSFYDPMTDNFEDNFLEIDWLSIDGGYYSYPTTDINLQFGNFNNYYLFLNLVKTDSQLIFNI